MSLTVEQEHLLKRELIRLEIDKEAVGLDNLANIDLLGAPFVTNAGTPSTSDELAAFKFVFHSFIKTMPLFAKTTNKFWTGVFQPFVQDLASQDISSSADRDEATKRRRIARAFKRMVVMLLVASISTNTLKQPTGRYKMPARYAAQPVKRDAPDAQPADPAAALPPPPIDQAVGPRATVIGVRSVASTSFFKSAETQYIVEGQLYGAPPVWVTKTYADFQDLNKRLIKAFPGKQLANLPSKNTADMAVKVNGETVTLLREWQRIALRHYLFRLCSLPKVANSDVFLEFLFKDRLPELSAEECNDINLRIDVDRQRYEDRCRFAELARERSQKLEKYLVEIKSQILGRDALPRLFLEMKRNSKVQDMSPLVQKLVEYSLIEVAALIYQVLIARDDSPEVFSQVKRLNRLMPYKVIQGILKLSNPALILKKMSDLFMAAPFGGNSLLQTMFIRMLSDDIRSQEKLIDELQGVLNDPTLPATLEEFVRCDYIARENIHTASDCTGHHLILTIFESSPNVPAATLAKVRRWHAAWQEAVAGRGRDDDDGVESYSQLNDLLKLMVRQHDKDILRNFWGAPLTIKFIRHMVNSMYDIFIEMFRTAGMSQSVGDFEKFISDLINTIDSMSDGLALDANQMVDGLIGVCQRHVNSLFRFINRVYAADTGFFVGIVEWLTRIVNFVRDGKDGHHRIDLVGMVLAAAQGGEISLEALINDLNELDSWLRRRKETADAEHVAQPATEISDGGNGFDVSDIGLSWDDVDFGLAEVERDEKEEFLPDVYEDLAQDAVSREKVRRAKLAQNRKRWEQLSARPESAEIAKLLPRFHALLAVVLENSRAEPTDLKSVDPTPLGLRETHSE